MPVLSVTCGGGPAILSSSHVPSLGGVDALWVQSTRVLHRLFFKNLGVYIYFCMDITPEACALTAVIRAMSVSAGALSVRLSAGLAACIAAPPGTPALGLSRLCPGHPCLSWQKVKAIKEAAEEKCVRVFSKN